MANDYQQRARLFARHELGCDMVGVGIPNGFTLLYCIRRFGYSPIGCDPDKMVARWEIGGVWIEFRATHYRITPSNYIATAEGLVAFEGFVMDMLRPVLIDGVAFNFLGEVEIDDPEFPDPFDRIAPPHPSAGYGVPMSWLNNPNLGDN